MLLSEKVHQQVHFWTLTLFCALLLPLPRLATLFAFLAGANWLISGNWKIKWQRFLHPLSILFSSVFFVYLIGMAYTENTTLGWANIETKLSLFLMPLLLLTGSQLHKKERHQLLKIFAISAFIASLFAISSSISLYFQTGELAFFYKKLAAQIHAHPAYFALYISFAFFIFLRWTLSDWQLFKTPQKTLFSIILIFLLLFLFLLSARTVMLVTLVLLGISTLVYAAQKGVFLKGILILIIGLIGVSAVIWTLPTTRKRVEAAINGTSENPNVRWQLWDAALEVYKDEFIFGQGTGDVQAALDAIYKEKTYDKPLQGHLNLHNQFLQTMAALGVIGLLFLLSNFIIPLLLSFRKRHWLYVLFIFLFMLSMLTESMLERQHGVLFFAFFNSLLALEFFKQEKS